MLPTLQDYYYKNPNEEWARLAINKMLGYEKEKPAVVTINTSFDMTFAEEHNSSHTIPESVNIPDYEPDQNDSVLDDDLSAFTSGEDSFFPALAAPAITSSEREVATPLVGQDNCKLNANTFLADSACSSHVGGCDSGMFDVWCKRREMLCTNLRWQNADKHQSW